MTPFAGRRLRAVAVVAAFAVTAAVSAVIGFLSMFSNFSSYDDEGYLLVSLSEYVRRGGHLYDDVYSQYGPFYYEVVGNLFWALGLPFTQNAGRSFTLGVWIATSLLLGIVTHRRTANLALGLGTTLLAYYALYSLAAEPMHPGGLLLLLLAAMLGAGEVIVTGRATAALAGLAALGALVGAAMTTKVNVGGFAAIAVAYACAVSFPPLMRSTAVRVLAGAVLVLAPLLLMVRDADRPEYLRFALLCSLSGAAVALVTAVRPLRDSSIPARRWAMALVGGFAAVVGVVCLVALLTGTSLDGLVHGALIDALRQPRVFTIAPSLPERSLVLGFAALAGAGLIAAAQLRGAGPRGPRVLLLSAVVRLVGGGAVWLAIAVWSAHTLALGLALAFLAAVPRPDEPATSRARFARAFLPSLAVLEALQAYPVAGSQADWAVVLLVPTAAVTLADGWADLRRWIDLRSPQWLPTLRLAGVVVAVALVARMAVPAWATAAKTAWPAYRDGVSLGLPGATWLRVPADQAETLRWVTGELRRNCSIFVSLPGLNSFYLWSQEPPPTGLNTTTWMFLLSADAQQRIVDSIDGIDRVCVLHSPGLVDFWRQSRPIPDRPLSRYIELRFTPQSARGGYAILVRKT